MTAVTSPMANVSNLETQYRYLQESVTSSSSERTVTGIFATDSPVLRYAYRWDSEGKKGQPNGYFNEVLSFDSKHVDSSRIDSGKCPYLKNHYSKKLGKVLSISLEGTLGRFTAKISRSEDGEDYLKDCEDGLSTGVSIGYSVRKYQEIIPPKFDESGRKTEIGTYKAVDWLLYEISDCDMPADILAGLDEFEGERSDSHVSLAFTRSVDGIKPINRIDDNMTTDKAQKDSDLQVLLDERNLENNQLKSDIAAKDELIQQLQLRVDTLTSENQQLNLRIELNGKLNDLRSRSDDLVAAFKLTLEERDSMFTLSDDLGELQKDVEFISRSLDIIAKRQPTLTTTIYSDGEKSVDVDDEGINSEAISAYERAYNVRS